MFNPLRKEKRRYGREACRIRATLRMANALALGGTITDLSYGGCRFRPHQHGTILSSVRAVLHIQDDRFACSLIGRAGRDYRLAFSIPLSDQVVNRLMG